MKQHVLAAAVLLAMALAAPLQRAAGVEGDLPWRLITPVQRDTLPEPFAVTADHGNVTTFVTDPGRCGLPNLLHTFLLAPVVLRPASPSMAVKVDGARALGAHARTPAAVSLNV